MRNYVKISIGVAALGLGGALYVFHLSNFTAAPPPPKSPRRVLPQAVFENVPAVAPSALRDTAASTPELLAAGGAQKPSPASEPSTAAEPSPAAPAGLTVSLTSNGKGVLKGEAVNTTAEAIEYMYPAGTLFSNGKGDVVLLHDTFVNLAPKKAAELSLSVAQTSSANGILSGEFSQRGEAEGPLHQLVHRISIKDSVAPSVAQTAVLILVDDAPLDTITSFPRLRPKALANTGPKPFCTAPQDLIAALALIRNAGIDLNKIAVMGEPQLEVMTMLNPDSHEAAMALFGITRETEWAYWQQELLQGDPSVRHYALYGIARYFPDVALEMLPSWVKTKTLPRSYRISAAWALALIEDSRANEELQGLRREFPDDAGLRQALDGALRHREGGNEKATGGTESKLNS